VHLDTIKVFYLPTDKKYSCFKIILKFTLKQLLHVSVQSQSSGSVLFVLCAFDGVAAATPPNKPQRCILTDYFNDYNFSKFKK
jgi:hypothetical protein